MTISLADRRDKSEAIDLFQRILQALVFHGIPPTTREGILAHLTWMRRQSETMHVGCQFETVPELRLTRIIIETSFTPKAPQ